MADQKIRVRFAPSPTGYLHIGSARTALFNWLYARKHGGTYVLRIEDTDTRRNTPEALAAILDGLRWLGLAPDEGPEQGGPCGPYLQSLRGDIHARHIAALQASDALYPCFCSREDLAQMRELAHRPGESWHYDGRCRRIDPSEARRRIAAGAPHTWRLKVTRPGTTTVHDMIVGDTTVDHADVEDIILIRADGTPMYNLTAVLDDHDMRITHVIRGQDHLTNTFKQVLIYEALGWEAPAFAHISLILAPPPHTGKLSKRHGGAEIKEYQERGYDPEALVNWLALIGWSYGEDREILAREELIARFDMANAGSANARMNPSKLDAISGQRLREKPRGEIARGIAPHLVKAGFISPEQPDYAAVLDLVCECAWQRIDCYAQAVRIVDWAFTPVAYEDDARKALCRAPNAPAFLEAYAGALPDPLPDPAALEAHARAFVQSRDLGFGAFAKAVRAALTGRMQTPPLFHCVALLGREKTCARLREGARAAAMA